MRAFLGLARPITVASVVVPAPLRPTRPRCSHSAGRRAARQPFASSRGTLAGCSTTRVSAKYPQFLVRIQESGERTLLGVADHLDQIAVRVQRLPARALVDRENSHAGAAEGR